MRKNYDKRIQQRKKSIYRNVEEVNTGKREAGKAKDRYTIRKEKIE